MKTSALALVAWLAAALACDRPLSDDPAQALYQRAHDAGLSRKEAEAQELYRRLLREHPGSRFSANAHLALAELLFNHGDFEAALLEYAQVLGFPEGKSWGYALYKQGWCHMNLQQPQRALEVFERVVGLTDDPRLPDVQRRDLVREARRDLVKAYAAFQPPEGAGAYFAKWGGGATTDLLDLLAERYFELEQLPAAENIYRELIVGQVDSPRLCDWQSSLVRMAVLSRSKKDQVAEVQRLGAVSARLDQNPKVPAATRELCRVRLRDTLKELALAAHKSGQKDRAPALFELADPLYRQYLTRFRSEKDAYAMTFYHAEVLWRLERWAEAAEEYRRVVLMEPQGKYRREAAYAFLLSTKNALKLDDAPSVVEAGADTLPRALSPAQLQMLAAIDFYAEHVPDGAELDKLKYRKARTYYEHRQYDKAAALARALVDENPGDPAIAVLAVNLELDALHTLGRNQQVCARVQALQASPTGKADPELASTLRALASDCAGTPQPSAKKAAPAGP